MRDVTQESGTNYIMFLDESGDRGLKHLDSGFPVLCLCGCIFPAASYDQANEQIDIFKRDFLGSTSVILTSRDVRRQAGSFRVLSDTNRRSSFYTGLNRLMEDLTYTIIAAVIRKGEHLSQYGSHARDPYLLSLEFILERFIHFLKWKGDAMGTIIAESRGKREDAVVQRHYLDVLTRGTFYRAASEFLRCLPLAIAFRRKEDNINGLQIADLAAYPIARTVIGGHHPSFEIVKGKFYGGQFGEPQKYGLKAFPRSVRRDLFRSNK